MNSKRKATRRLTGFLPLLILLLSACEKNEPVYVTAGILNLRQEPTTQSQVLARLSRGEQLNLHAQKENWLQVSTDNGITGWVHGNYVGDPAAVRDAHLKERKTRRKKPYLAPPSTQTTPIQPTPTQTVDPTTLNISIYQLTASLEIDIEELDAMENEQRFGATGPNNETLEFWGNPQNLTRAALLVPVVNTPDETLSQSADLVVTFIRNAVPGWRRDSAWMANKLRQLTSRDIGEGEIQAGQKTVRFTFIKPLGSVRIFIDPRSN